MLDATMANTEVNDDYNLQEAWTRHCTAYANITGGIDLTKPPRYTPDEVLEQIRAKQDDDEEKNAKYRAAKDVIGKTLYCINILGGIAAQAAGMVFGGPSTLCFNAVSYLIETGVNYKRIFSSLAELFRRISDVLERCKIYMRMPPESVDIALRKIINEELLSFISICALSTKVLKGHKIFIALKVFAFNSDEGVSAELNRLAYLVDKEDQMRGTLGFESQKTSEKAITETKEGTKKINATVDKVLEFEQRRDADNKEKKQLSDIDTNLDTPSESYKIVQGTYKGLVSKKVDGSGEWLKTDPTYTVWRDRMQSSLSVLCISGSEGYGKSFLFPTIIRDLQDRYSQVPDDLTCTSVAYYFFEQESIAKGSQTAEKDASSLIKALKVLAWQIANNDLVYRKDLALAKSAIINQIAPLWDLLFAKSYKTDSTFFLLLDGTDQMDRDHLKEFTHLLVELQKLSGTWGKFCLRILLAGRDDTVDRIMDHLDKDSSVIHVASKNGDDIEKFIKSRMSRMDILGGTSSQVETLKNEILTNLSKEAHGDFINVGLLLNEIGDKQRPGEIRDVLSKSGEKRSDTIARKIERLNDTLGDDDISDLNELLTWVMYALRPLTLTELQVVLFIKNHEPSLRSLADEIKERYSALFRVLGDPDPETKIMPPTATVSLVSDSIEEYFTKKAEKEAIEDNHASTETGDVNESEVRIVKRFLESVCDPKLFKKFEFESFFDRKLSKRTAKVGIDVETAHLKIATVCVQVICSEESTELAALLDYATVYFITHLNEVDPSLTEPQSKIKIGPELVKLFADEKTIQRWWTDDGMWMRYNWLYDDDYPDIVLKWLQDSAVSKKLSDEEKKWVKSLSSKSEPDADLLEHVAKYLSARWLQNATWDLTSLFSFVHGYLTKIANRKNPAVERSMMDARDATVDTTQILAAAEWARQQIGVETLGYEETRNLARTFREYGKPEEAIEKFKLASSMKSDNWLAQWGLALTYHNQEEWTLALETLAAVKKAIESGEAVEDDPSTEISEIIRNLASWNKEAGNDEKALEIYESILKDEPEDYDTAFEIMSLLRKKGDFAKLVEFLEALKQSKDENTGLDRRTQIFHTQSWNRDYHEIIAIMGAHTKNFDVVKDGYQTAVDAAEAKLKIANIDREDKASTTGIMAMLLHFFALFFYNNYSNESEKETAVSLWERILGMEASEKNDYSYLPYAKGLVTSKLSSVYLRRALNAEMDSEYAALCVKHLEQLSTTNSDEEIYDWSTQTYPKQLLARYYALTTQPEKAKDVLRSHIKIGIDLLSDEDPSNDWQGYKSLVMHLMFAGQDDNAHAAWSLITPEKQEEEIAKVEGQDSPLGDQTEGSSDPKPLDDSATTKQEPVGVPTKKLEGPLSYNCDGRCGNSWTYADDIYVCRECSDIQFDEGCLAKLRAGTLQRQICHKDHEMFHVPKYDKEKLDSIGEGNVKVGEEIMTVEDWIQRIRKEWAIAV